MDAETGVDAELRVPEKLREPVAAALDWINRSQGQDFALTGLLDYEAALDAAEDQAFELGLVLCDGELCIREQIRCTPLVATDSALSDSKYEFSAVDAAPRDIPPLLDPPQGVRSQWLADVLDKHEFVLLLFYRGLW